MMTASEAHNESQYNGAIVELENKISEEIKKATVNTNNLKEKNK